MKTNICKNCINLVGTSCTSAVVCPVQPGRAKTVITGIILLFAATTATAQEPEFGYLVTIRHLDNKQRTEVLRLDDLAKVDSIVTKTFSRSIPWFDAKEMLNETQFFEIISERKSLYCERKRIVGRKKNGELRLRNLKRWRS